MTDLLFRWLAAGATVVAYMLLCVAIFWRERRRHAASARAALALAGDGSQQPVWVIFASQTGQAESLAWRTAGWLHAAGTPARVLPLDEPKADALRGVSRALFIASTYGEGDAPDGASVFAEQVMASSMRLPALRYAVLALGDRQYSHFCGFGRALDTWLQSTSATAALPRIDVDNGDPASLAIWERQWRADVSGDGGTDGLAEAADVGEAAAEPVTFRLARRQLLNAGSAGHPVFHLAFVPADGRMCHWESGDLARLSMPSDPGQPRDYSIASIASDGELHLLVRQEQHADGTLGLASGLLTSTLTVGATVPLLLRPHRNFRLEQNAALPLILIGNGTGLAGLRSHLRARAAAGRNDNWLIFGERNAEHDFLYRDDIAAWQAQGHLRRLDMVFSRDQADRFYVQHRLLQAADELTAWIERGAAVYVCGSLQGMASGVDAALHQVIGDAAIGRLMAQGRYRKDVY